MTQRLLLLCAALALVIASTRYNGRPFGHPTGSAHYAFGQGPTVVMVHGLGSRIGHWLPTARLLAKTHRVVLVELPGHGTSDLPEPLTLERATVSLDAALADLDEPFTLVGHSLGGVVAANWAIEHPGRLRSLVLVEAPLRPAFDEAGRREIRAALDRDFAGTIRDVYTSFGRDSIQGAALAAEAAQMDPRAMRAWIELALDADLSQAVRDLRVPVTAVFAERNWEPGRPWAEVANDMGYAQVPAITPILYLRTGHFAMLDRPADLARTIAASAPPAAHPASAR